MKNQSHRGLLVAALMMVTMLSAMDSTIVSTAMPTIVGKLGGLALFSWVFSIYLLTSTVSVPIYGKLADIYGRKPMLLISLGTFLAASALCGTAQSMTQLILFRALQGFGAGGIITSNTIIGDVFTVEQRAKIQGLFSSMWGISGISGPIIGGLLTDIVGWRWVFYINLPLGLISMAMVWSIYKEQVQHRSHSIDYLGAGLLTGCITALLMAVSYGASTYGWSSLQTIGMLLASAALLPVFIWQESRAKEPIVPLRLFNKHVIAVASIGVFATGAVYYCAISMVPLFSQGVHAGGASRAGIVLTPMLIGWPLSSIFSGRLIVRKGYFVALVTGSFFLVSGTGVLLFLNRGSSIGVVFLAMFLLGVGMGFTMNSFTIAVQNAVQWGQRGVATASSQFFRTIGGTLGVAVVGAVLNAHVIPKLRALPGIPEGSGYNFLVDADNRASIPPATLASAQEALSSSLHQVYLLVFGIALVVAVVIWFFPRGRIQDIDQSEVTSGGGQGTKEGAATKRN